MKLKYKIFTAALFTMTISLSSNSQAGLLRWFVGGAQAVSKSTTVITTTTSRSIVAGSIAYSSTGLLLGIGSLLAYYKYVELKEFPVTPEIQQAKINGQIAYTPRICLDSEGSKVAVPSSFSVCPFDGKPVQMGTEMDLRRVEL